MVKKLFILKGVAIVLQLVLIFFIVATAIHLKDIKTGQELIESEKAKGRNAVLPDIESLSSKVNTRYGVLLTVVILSSLKALVFSGGIFLNHIWILLGSCIMDVIIGSLYMVHWNVNIYIEYVRLPSFSSTVTTNYSGASWVALISSLACGIITVFVIINIRKQARA